jgi:hypothetical protein
MLYLQSGCLDPPTEMDLDPFDPTLGVHWPTLLDVPRYIMSDKVQPELLSPLSPNPP